MSSPVLDLYEFGPFRLDVQRRVLARGDEIVPLPPKTFELLVLLLHSEGRAVSKHELMAALWPDTFVEEANLSFQISTLRKALGNSGLQWIETLPKHGYRFAAEVNPTSPEGHDAARQVATAEGASARRDRRGIRTRTTWTAAVFVVLLVSASLYISTLKGRPTTPVKGALSAALPLTAYQGFENAPSFSPDGSQVAFAWNGPRQDNYDIYVKLVGPGPPRPLTTDPAREDNPAWSPDGLLIAFERFTTADTADVYVIPALGGAEKRVATNLLSQSRMESQAESNGSLRWSPDGKWLAHLGGPAQGGIWLIAVDGSGTRRLTERGVEPAFSPDGRQLAFVRLAAALPAVYVLPLSTALIPAAMPRQVTPEYPYIRGLAWTPGGDALVYAASGHMGLSRLHRIALASNRLEPNGPPEFLTFGENASAVTISKTGRLVYSAQVRDVNIWKLSLTGENRLKNEPVVSDTFDDGAPDYSPDGKRLAFSSTRSGNEEIWVANADGSNPVQMTTMRGPVCSNPRWSPDGRLILFHSSGRQNSRALYVLDTKGGSPYQLTDQPTRNSQASWSRNGRLIHFASDRAGPAGRMQIWRMSADGGNPTQVTKLGGTMPIESLDGRFLYYTKLPPPLPIAIWRVPVDGGEERFIVGGLSDTLNFAVAKEGLYFLAVGDAQNKTSIDFFEFKTGARKTILKLDKFWWYGMALSPDQQTLLYSVVDSAGSNLMLVEQFH